MSVLIVKRAALGDVLRTTTLLPAVRKRWGGPVWWLTDEAAAPLLKGHPLVDRVVTSPRDVDRRFDLALSLEEDAACARRAAETGTTLVGVLSTPDGELSYTETAEDYYGMSLLRSAARGGKAKADELKAANRRTFSKLWLDILGLPAEKSAAPVLRLTPAERAAGARELSRLGLTRARPIGLNAGAGGRWPSKQLTEDAAAALARGLKALGRPVLLLGGREEAPRNARVARAAGEGVFVQRPVDLRVFAAVVARCAGAAVTDTLAAHVAAAAGIAVVALVGPTSAAELDLGARGRALTPESGCDCFYAARCRRLTPCLADISPARVVSTLRRLGA